MGVGCFNWHGQERVYFDDQLDQSGNNFFNYTAEPQTTNASSARAIPSLNVLTELAHDEQSNHCHIQYTHLFV